MCVLEVAIRLLEAQMYTAANRSCLSLLEKSKSDRKAAFYFDCKRMCCIPQILMFITQFKHSALYNQGYVLKFKHVVSKIRPGDLTFSQHICPQYATVCRRGCPAGSWERKRNDGQEGTEEGRMRGMKGELSPAGLCRDSMRSELYVRY